SVLTPPGQSVDLPAKNPDLATSGRRLAFARWLTSGTNPLVARVLVNRAWLHDFGRGLVSTPSDFGVMGERPSHPELLDWLATDFVEHGWRLKRLHKLIMTSTAYRQSSRQSGSTKSIPRSSRREEAHFSDRKSTRLNSSHLGISYAVLCLKKNKRPVV